MTSHYLEVTFEGLAAWVPRIVAEGEITGYDVLWPDAQFADRAYWIRPDDPTLPHVCEPHQAILMANSDEVAQEKGTERYKAYVRGDARREQALFRIDHAQVLFPNLPEASLTFDVPTGQWGFDTLAHMRQISPRHRWARKALNPANPHFDPTKLGLGGAMSIGGGNLSVSQLFDDGEEVRFARVKSREGELQLGRKVRKSPLGNQILWRAPLNGDSVRIEFRRTEGVTVEESWIEVKAEPVARIRLVNTELEGPVFGLSDPFKLPEGGSRFPDPDFGVYYPLSSSTSRKGRRVPVEKGSTIGSKDKPCAPAVFAGFR